MDDYKKAINKLGWTQQEMDRMKNFGEVINDNSPFVYRAKSKIHGEGMFAQVNIKKDSFLGLASVAPVYKTFLGRYTNHSFNANIKFTFDKDSNVCVVAIKNIKKDEEILVDYTDHIPSKNSKEIVQQLQQLADKSSEERKEKIYKLIRKLKNGQQ